MGDNKYVRLDVLADDTYRLKIGNDGCYVQHTLPTEAHALHFIIKHAEPFSRMEYNSERLQHVFNNALQHMWHDMEEGTTYSHTDCEQLIRKSTPYQMPLFDNKQLPLPLGACSTSYVGDPRDSQGAEDWQEADTLDNLLKQ